MPELPEVETVARTLAPAVTDRFVEAVAVRSPRGLDDPAQSAEVFAQRLVGRRILGVRRRGKLLVLPLDDGQALACHLRMTGRLYVPLPDDPPDAHTHLVFTLRGTDGPTTLYYRDARTFGGCRVATAEELAAWPFHARMGPEPLELDAAGFRAALQGRSTRVKALLLDQTAIAGLGNIYVDEALFRAGIRPETPADRLGPRRVERLRQAVQAVLTEAIEACGSSIRDYVDARGAAGSFQKCFRVYGRGGEPCLACGERLRKTAVAGRGTVYCPRCQRG